MTFVYDTIGRGYADFRRPDPRIAAQIHAALGDARTVVNVGAGTGSYEPTDRTVVAVEPSEVMLAQRRGGTVVRAVAEALPFPDRAFDAAMAILTVHHWTDPWAGLAELRRVAPRRVVFATDEDVIWRYWFLRDYVGELFGTYEEPPVGRIAEAVGADRVEVIPVPVGCTDGFFAAYWKRPEAYLDAGVRAAISPLARMDPAALEEPLGRLADDIRTGAWAERNAELADLETFDAGYRLLISTA